MANRDETRQKSNRTQLTLSWTGSIQECGLTGRRYSYNQMAQLVRRFGSSLARMGLKRGEVLGLVLPNMPEFPIALLGAAGMGMPVTTVNPIYTIGELTMKETS